MAVSRKRRAAGRKLGDHRNQGLNRSTLADAAGVPLHLVAAGANRHDAPLLEPPLAGLDAFDPLPAGITAHLDRGYDRGVTRRLLAGLVITGEIARQGIPAPRQGGKRWVIERTQAWMNGDGTVRRRTERTGHVVDCYLFLAATFVVPRCLIREARSRYRWPTRPTTRRLT